MIGAALAFKAAPYAIALALGAGALAWVGHLRADNANKTLAITQLQKRAVELHGAWEAEQRARVIADENTALLAQQMQHIEARDAGGARALARIAESDAPSADWNRGRVPARLDRGVRDIHAAAFGASGAPGTASEPDPPVPGAAGPGE